MGVKERVGVTHACFCKCIYVRTCIRIPSIHSVLDCSDGEWDFDNYSVVVLGQRKELPVTAMAAVKFNVWCGTGNYIHVVGGSSLKMEVSILIHTVYVHTYISNVIACMLFV